MRLRGEKLKMPLRIDWIGAEVEDGVNSNWVKIWECDGGSFACL